MRPVDLSYLAGQARSQAHAQRHWDLPGTTQRNCLVAEVEYHSPLWRYRCMTRIVPSLWKRNLSDVIGRLRPVILSVGSQ